MDSKMLWVLVAAAAVYFLFIRKKTALVIGATSTSAALPNAYLSPKPAMPQPTTAQVAIAAGIKAAPSLLSSLGSLFSSDDDVDTSADDLLD